jgi:hypothetical protein
MITEIKQADKNEVVSGARKTKLKVQCVPILFFLAKSSMIARWGTVSTSICRQTAVVTTLIAEDHLTISVRMVWCWHR